MDLSRMLPAIANSSLYFLGAVGTLVYLIPSLPEIAALIGTCFLKEKAIKKW